MATVSTSTGTYLQNLVDPEVMAALIESKLIDAIKLSPLAVIDRTLAGRPGSTITLPYYAYIGDAEIVAEGSDIPVRQLSAETKEVSIAKAGIGVQLTDEAVLSGFGDPLGQAVKQVVTSIASTVETKLYAAMDGNTNVHTISAELTADDIADAMVKFGEDYEGEKVLLIDPATSASLRKANDWSPGTEMAAQMVVSGVVGMIHGAQVVVTNRIKAASGKINYHIVKPGALALFIKRDVLVETDRDIVNKSTVMTADEHFAAYLLDESKAVRIERTV